MESLSEDRYHYRNYPEESRELLGRYISHRVTNTIHTVQHIYILVIPGNILPKQVTVHNILLTVYIVDN